MDHRALVVCYSRSGATLRVGRYVAEKLGADFELIEESGSREGKFGYVRSALEALTKGLPTIQTHKDPRQYDLVVLGTPVWVGTMASPIRSYVYEYRSALKNAAFFAVMGGRGAAETLEELKLACDSPSQASCAFTQREVESERFTHRCDEFIRKLAAPAVAPLHRASA